MRAGIGAVHHTLTPEASSVLKRAISDAQRRGHAQVTPLHVASSLLSAPSSMLQQACLQSHHRQVPHPLHSRALDLCFNVALDRLPAASSSGSSSNSSQNHHQQADAAQSISLSNALVAALKRAQAHQRRGSPEQQQVPLLAVKVEMEQLVISILDDPSVSRVMREAGFSSTRAKSSLEHSSSMSRRSVAMISSGDLEIISCSGVKADQSSAALGVLGRSRRQRNPVLIGDELSTSFVVKEVMKAIRLHEQFRGARILNLAEDDVKNPVGFGVSKEVTQRWISEMVRVVDDEKCEVPILVLIGSLSWCEQSPVGGLVLGELARVLAMAESKQKKLWFIACATSHCYMRFLAQFPAMESQLGFQPLPVSSSASIRPRFPPASDTQAFLRNFPKMPFRLMEDDELGACCTECTTRFEQESSKLLLHEQNSTDSSHSSSGDHALPLWMMKNSSNTRAAPSPGHQTKELIRELKRKWIRNCQSLHSPATTLPNLIDSNSSSSQTSSPEAPGRKKVPSFEAAASWLSLSTVTELETPELSLGLGLENSTSCNKSSVPEVVTELSLSFGLDKRLEDERFDNGIQCKFRTPGDQEDLSALLKKIFKGLREKVPWQIEAAGKVASAVINSRSGEKRRGSALKSDAWILFSGGDRMGKRRLARGLAEVLYGSAENLVMLSLSTGSGRARRRLWGTCLQDGASRGRTVTDRVADAIRSKPFSVVLLEDYDHADVSVRRSLVRSMERGKIQHSSGREVGFGNSIVILTVSASRDKSPVEEKLEGVEEAPVYTRMKNSGGGHVHGNILIVEEGNVLLQEELEVECVGEKRKPGSGSGWGEKIERLLTGRKKTVRDLDLNLGLGSWDSCEAEDDAESLKFDERVEFEELKCLEFVAATVMDRLQKLACRYGVSLEVEVRALQTMLASVWEEADGFDKWFKETIEDLVTGSCSGRKWDKVLEICC